MMELKESDIRAIVEQIVCQSVPAQKSCGEPILVETSARHVHLTKEAVETLFGAGYTLNKKKDLSQPGEFATEVRVKLVTPKGVLDRVAVLGPVRKAVQVELSVTDCRVLGLNAPVNLSGDLSGAADVLLVGPAGYLMAKGSVIVAKAHIHMTPADALRYGVADGETVAVRLQSKRPVTLENVMVRVRENFSLAMHIDFDESNAALADCKTTGVIQKGSCAAPISQPVRPQACVCREHVITETVAKELATQGEVHLAKNAIITPAAQDVFSQRRVTVYKDCEPERNTR